jgi:hypothetical protein
MIEALRKVIKRMHCPLDVMLTCVRWYAAYPLSLRHIEEMMAERGVCVDHATVHRWAMKILPVLAAVFRRRKPVGLSWRMDETYIKVAGQWKYLYRAVDRDGDTIDFLLRAKRTTRLLGSFWNELSVCMVCLRRSPSKRAAPTRLPSSASTTTLDWASPGMGRDPITSHAQRLDLFFAPARSCAPAPRGIGCDAEELVCKSDS